MKHELNSGLEKQSQKSEGRSRPRQSLVSVGLGTAQWGGCGDQWGLNG